MSTKRFASLAIGTVSLLSLGIAPSVASAQSAIDGNFATLERIDDTSTFEADLSLTFFDDQFADATGLGLNLHGSYYFTPGFGGYATLPIGRVLLDDEDDVSGIGNVELGGVFAPEMNGPLAFLGRVGLSLPTANDNLAYLFSSYARITDLVLGAPDITTLRLSGSLLGRSGQIFWRLDGGLDVPFDTGDSVESIDPDPLIHLNGGIGVDTTSLAFTAELASLGVVGDLPDGSDRFIHTLGLSLRSTNGSFQPMIALVAPVGSDIDAVNFSLIVGISAPISGPAR